MRFTVLFVAFISSLIHWGCQPNGESDDLLFPAPHQIAITWEVLNDAIDASMSRTAVFTITNLSDTTLPRQGWRLFYNQFPATISVPPEADQRYSIHHEGGDLYSITPLDSFPTLDRGESLKISYRAPYAMVKKTHGPQGLYLASEGLEQGTIPLTNYKIKPFPSDFTFETGQGEKSIFIDPETRYLKNSGVRSLPVETLSPITPTPIEWNLGADDLHLNGLVEIDFDAGLEEEADHLSNFLQTALLIPPRSVDLLDTTFISLRLQTPKAPKSEASYSLKVNLNGIEIIGSDPAGVFYGIQSLKALMPKEVFSAPMEMVVLPSIDVKDGPRFGYRGLMLDIARNFQPVQQIKKVISLMAFYKLNKLHLHLTDDEGWRLEIPGLPELTEIGAKRGPESHHGTMLPAAYGSGSTIETGSGSGFINREQYIEILRYAKSNHIEVIPEINGPGHARAAIKAMQARFNRLTAQGKGLEAAQYLLHDEEDASEYTSAQHYHDNVICVCRESTYDFLQKVISEIVQMHREANAPLSIIHSGGDEVPSGAWTGSPECIRLLKQAKDLQSPDDLFPYFVSRYAKIAAEVGLRIAGWEEIVMKVDPENIAGKHIPNERLLAADPIPFVWNSAIGGGSEDLIYKLANLGYEVIMSNASNLYLDMAYNYEPDEPGLYWAGYVDTKNAFELTPFDLFRTVMEDEQGNPLDGIALGQQATKLESRAEKNILGIQGQLWSETIKDQGTQEYMLLPKLLGVAERAWAKPPDWLAATDRGNVQEILDHEWQAFANRIGKVELPRLDRLNNGYHYRIPPPGALVKDGVLFSNSTFPGLEIRFTTDGSDPNPYSPLFTEAVNISGAEVIKLRTFNTANRASRLTELHLR